MIEIRHLDTCSFQTAFEIWNQGFQGYPIDLTLTLDSFLARIISHGISPADSLVAFIDEEPVGFLLNGIRVSGDGRLAWNGGTAVVPEMRGKGVGKKLVEAAIDLYEQKSIERATLEAISTNESAIKLYSSCGYQVVDELTILQNDNVVRDWVVVSSSDRYMTLSVAPAKIGRLSFYYKLSPWQAQWESVALVNGEAILVHDRSGAPIGYALFKKKFDKQGEVESIGLFQCEVAPNRSDASEIALFTLQNVFGGDPRKFRRNTHNLRKSNQMVVNLLLDAGFTTFIEQVHMTRNFG
jgi:ribosomal protein S18 acetylase RimI-like enzyme